MIIEGILNAIKFLLFSAFSWISIPQLSSSVQASIDSFLELIFSNIKYLGLFVHMNFVGALLIALLAIILFESMYKLIMWILRKIPMLGMN